MGYSLKADRKRNKLYPYHGEMLTVIEISRITGIPPDTLRKRIRKHGYNEETTTLQGRQLTFNYRGYCYTRSQFESEYGLPHGTLTYIRRRVYKSDYEHICDLCLEAFSKERDDTRAIKQVIKALKPEKNTEHMKAVREGEIPTQVYDLFKMALNKEFIDECTTRISENVWEINGDDCELTWRCDTALDRLECLLKGRVIGQWTNGERTLDAV